jgi:arylsulfatase A-like enzyme
MPETLGDRPNVVFLLADNLGYGDVGCYGAGELRGMPTPNIDALAAESVQLNQFLVESACTPSRSACMTGRLSIRSGLSVCVAPGGRGGLSENEYTLGNLFKDSGYSTRYYGKWHLGERTETEPQFFGFDQWKFGFYGSSDGSMSGDNLSRYHAPAAFQEAATVVLREASEPRTPSTTSVPYDTEIRKNIDNLMVDDLLEYIAAQSSSTTPFFAFVGLTRPHFPNIPSDRFEGASRIGGYGDCVMELDWNVGRVVSAIRNAGIEDNTILVFVSDNGPTVTATVLDEMHVASAGPWRGELGEPWEGSIRTVGMVRWPDVIPTSEVSGMVSIMDFLPTFASILGTELPSDRPIDGVDQLDYLTGRHAQSNRDSLLTFIGDRLAAVRWNQWRMYTAEYTYSSTNPAVGGWMGLVSHPHTHPLVFNIEADPHEQRNRFNENTWLMRPYAEVIGDYLATLGDHPNPPAPNFIDF